MSCFSNPKITPFHGYLLCMSGTFALSQISGIIILIEDAKRDSFISTIFAGIAYLVYAYWIYRIVKNQPPNQSFLDVLERKMGKPVAWVVKCWITLYLFFELFVDHKNIVTWVKAIFLPFTPIWAISLPLLIVCAYLAVKGIKPIAIMGSVLFPIVITLIVFMALSTLKYRHYDLLLPLFSEGALPIFKGSVNTLRTGMDLFLFVLLSPHIQGRIKWKHMAVFSFFIILLIINTVAGLIATFGPYEASRQRFPLFTQWRLVSISSFVEHLDFLSMNQWLSSTTIFMSLGLFLVGDLLASKKTAKKVLILAFTALLFIMVELEMNDTVFLTFCKTFFYPLSTISILCWTLLASLITRRRGSA